MELLPLLILHPPITGYYARSKGYKYWPWFFIGLFFPVISNMILYFLKDKPVQGPEIILYEHTDVILFSKDGFSTKQELNGHRLY
jgi:hypothetical protein